MIGVIADDLTGAAELAAVGWRHGLDSEVLIQGAPSTSAQLVCADTDSRNCSPAEAGRRVVAAARQLLAAGARWIYKKVDSVLRGPIMAEIEALRAFLHLRRVFLVPANPSKGRCIRRGRYWIGGRPIDATDFGSDPELPRRSPSVRELLGACGWRSVTVCAPTGRVPLRGIIVGEAASEHDLHRWARLADGATLTAGAAEFFEALLQLRGFPVVGLFQPPRACQLGKGMLFVCGSSSQRTQAFVAEAHAGGVPVVALLGDAAKGNPIHSASWRQMLRRARSALQSRGRLILTVSPARIRNVTHARALLAPLAELAAEVLNEFPYVHVFVEGGATAAALLRRLGVPRLQVQEVIGPGVVTLRADGPRPWTVTVKPGSYPWPREVAARCVAGEPLSGAEVLPPVRQATSG